MKFAEVVDPIDLEILDWPASAREFLALEAARYVSIEGSAVPQLRKEFSADLVARRVGEAALFSTVGGKVATFRKTPELIERLLPLLALDDWSIFHLNLHGETAKLIEGYDWGEGCCPVSLAGDLAQFASHLVEARVARPWTEDAGE